MLTAAAALAMDPTEQPSPREPGLAPFLPRWLPAEPLIAMLDAHCRASSLRAVVRSSGIDRRTFERVRHRRRIRSDSADRIAVALGCHPSEIWPEWFAEKPR